MTRLTEVVEASAKVKHGARLGRVEEVLVDGPSKTDPAMWSGRTRHNKLLHFPPSVDTAAGDLVRARVTGAAPHWLRGELTERVRPARRRRVRIPVVAV
jgi:tRNA-2-methylthio-N6-dimethylallyladenosine synthase